MCTDTSTRSRRGCEAQDDSEADDLKKTVDELKAKSTTMNW